MELTPVHYERIVPHLPVRRGNVSLSNLQVLNAILYLAEHGCKWRGLPAHFGNWYTIYTRMNRWSKLLNRMDQPDTRRALIMDRAYEGDKTRETAVAIGYEPVVPPRRNRVDPWEYDRELYKRRNGVERLFRRLKGFRRFSSRFEKLDVVFLGFIVFTLIIDAMQ